MTKPSNHDFKTEAVLSAAEKAALARYETVIENGWKTFVKVEKALEAIRDKRRSRNN